MAKSGKWEMGSGEQDHQFDGRGENWALVRTDQVSVRNAQRRRAWRRSPWVRLDSNRAPLRMLTR